MSIEKSTNIRQENMVLTSLQLDRRVEVDLYLCGEARDMRQTSLLLINDGQDLGPMGFAEMLDDLYGRGLVRPLLCVGIHAGEQRMMEYGTAGRPDYQGRGTKADAYTRFIFDELIPFVRRKYRAPDFREKAFAGFSMGALSAMDIVWGHPQEFSCAGLFSGSFWWRTRDKNDAAYNEQMDRIMHDKIRKGGYYPWLRFFFECGTEDETEDRNGNGIIDSIDDTQDIIKALLGKGYDPERDIRYLEIAGGHHDVATWGRAMPEFLLWSFSK